MSISLPPSGGGEKESAFRTAGLGGYAGLLCKVHRVSASTRQTGKQRFRECTYISKVYLQNAPGLFWVSGYAAWQAKIEKTRKAVMGREATRLFPSAHIHTQISLFGHWRKEERDRDCDVWQRHSMLSGASRLSERVS